MVMYRTPEAMARAMKRKVQSLKKDKIRSSSKVATFMLKRAIQFAPRGETGDTIKGIKKSKVKGGYQVVSRVPGRFKQNLWANQTAPFRTMTWPEGNRRYGIKPGTKGLYGVSPTHFTWTGKPRFWHWATLDTMVKFKKIVRMNTKKSLRVGV